MIDPSLGARITFWIVAAMVVGGAVLTVTRRNPVASVMSLVATFFGLAACYAMLSAHFLAALQVLLYPGAIMVLFIFVVMVLNRDEVEPIAWRGLVTKLIGAAAILYLVVKLAAYLFLITPARTLPPPPEFGTVENVGALLFTDDLFAFEAVSPPAGTGGAHPRLTSRSFEPRAQRLTWSPSTTS